MKTWINEFGVLELQPDSLTEAYALRCWLEKAYVPMADYSRAEQGFFRGSSIEVVSGKPEQVAA